MFKLKIYFYLILFVSLFFSVISLSTTFTKDFDLIFSASKLWYINDVNYEKEYLDKVSIFFNIDRELLTINNSSFLIKAKDLNSPIYISKEEETDVSTVSNESSIELSSILPFNSTVFVKGRDGGYIYNYTKYIFEDSNNSRDKRFLESTNYVEPINDRLFVGEDKNFDNNIKELLNSELIKVKDKEILIEEDYDSEIFNNLSINSFVLNSKVKQSYSLTEDVVIGSIKVTMGNCNRDTSISVVFNPLENKVFLNDLRGFVNTLCKKQFIQYQDYLIGTCVDCTLYPVGKGYALNSDYAPVVVSADFEGSYKQVNKDIYSDLKDMYLGAREDGIYMSFTSAYRSYLDQYYTYEYWVSVEMSKGYSRYEAEAIANTYSAIPGFSEHQLGTTIDINGLGCSISDYCSSNVLVWDWLKSNAYKYGFVMSYQEGKESETGYIHEPWHYRWIGIELATEYFNNFKDFKTLQSYLYDLGRY